MYKKHDNRKGEQQVRNKERQENQNIVTHGQRESPNGTNWNKNNRPQSTPFLGQTSRPQKPPDYNDPTEMNLVKRHC